MDVDLFCNILRGKGHLHLPKSTRCLIAERTRRIRKGAKDLIFSARNYKAKATYLSKKQLMLDRREDMDLSLVQDLIFGSNSNTTLKSEFTSKQWILIFSVKYHEAKATLISEKNNLIAERTWTMIQLRPMIWLERCKTFQRRAAR